MIIGIAFILFTLLGILLVITKDSKTKWFVMSVLLSFLIPVLLFLGFAFDLHLENHSLTTGTLNSIILFLILSIVVIALLIVSCKKSTRKRYSVTLREMIVTVASSLTAGIFLIIGLIVV